MSLADDIIDRQRLRRKLSFWRIAAFVAVLALVVFAAFSARSALLGPGAATRAHIAKVEISGAITEDEDLLERLNDIAESDAVKGVILTINSPGGTTAGGEAIYEAVRDIAEAEKPVVAQVGTLAASAGYMIATGADHIAARKTSIVGSIGVIFQYPNIEGLLDTLGIDMRSIKSTPLKAEPAFFGETPPGAEAMIRRMILDSYDWFKDLVAERREFTPSEINRLADGSVFTGRQALENKLIDELGGIDAAMAWLSDEGVSDKLPVIEWKRRDRNSRFLLSQAVVSLIREAIGLPGGADSLPGGIYDRLFLDGLVSVWHGQE